MNNDKAGQLSEADEVAEAADTAAAGDATPGGTADMQTFIGRQLRAVFDDVARQPVPDRFLELMKQLETKTTKS